MKHNEIKSNKDLCEYIYWLDLELRKRGQEVLADKLVSANDFADGSPSEFLHEAGSALKEVTSSNDAKLSDAEKEDVAAVIRLIEEAFTKVGGA